jgi:hypothetical protein
MKTKLLPTMILGLLMLPTLALARVPTEKELLGVYKLTKFATVDAHGAETPWCEAAEGSIAYLPGFMSVSINCAETTPGTQAASMGGVLFYSGPFEIDTRAGEVIHRARNGSHPSLVKVHRRKLTMNSSNHLLLSGQMPGGGSIVIEWERSERFAYDNSALTGVYELVGSENEVPGSLDTIPFCTGFHGTIMYTPGGFGAVSINCGEKADPNAVEPADQFGRKYFYAGPYHQAEQILVQKMALASEVAHRGGEARREMLLEGDLLTLKGTNGSKFVATWKKLRSFVGLR